MTTATETRIPRHLKRSAPLLPDVVFHDAGRVADLVIERLLGGSQLGYTLTCQEQRLLAAVVEVRAVIRNSVYTANYELKAKGNGARSI